MRLRFFATFCLQSIRTEIPRLIDGSRYLLFKHTILRELNEMAKRSPQKTKYKRILLKLSGEAFQNKETGHSLDIKAISKIASQLKKAKAKGCEIAIVVGGGNIFRGGESLHIDRNTGDYMGMLSTVINCLALQSSLEKMEVPTRVMTAFPIPAVAEPFVRRKATRHLEKGRIVIFGAGTGNPYLTTDTAAALRANETNCDLLIKGTKVDGIYTEDPVKNQKAKRYQKIGYSEALSKELKIMDAAAFSLCKENNLPIIVFNFFKQDEIIKVLDGKPVGTLVGGSDNG